MTLSDLIFIGSALLVLVMSARAAFTVLRGWWSEAHRLARLLGLFVAGYALALIAVALVLPRRTYAAGERRCIDDWCITALDAKLMDPANTWMATVEVSSVAKRVRQRARDARVEMEDLQGRRYSPAGAESPRSITDELSPGESFRAVVLFRLPGTALPAGLVVHHGDFPGVLIIGSDASFLHPRALLRLAPISARE